MTRWSRTIFYGRIHERIRLFGRHKSLSVYATCMSTYGPGHACAQTPLQTSQSCSCGIFLFQKASLIMDVRSPCCGCLAPLLIPPRKTVHLFMSLPGNRAPRHSCAATRTEGKFCHPRVKGERRRGGGG